MGPNNSFKPNLLRYTKAMAEKACHGFGSTTQVGLTQALGAYRGFMKYGCKGKSDVLLQLNYMVIHAPEFPPEGGMTLSLAFETVEYGLSRIESEDARPAVVAAIGRIRATLRDALVKFDAGDIVPACHLLQDAEDLLRPIRVKDAVA